MQPQLTLIPSAEAAFIAGLDSRQMNRVVDEHLFPDVLVGPEGATRLFTRLGAAFALFYFSTDDVLLAGVRREVVEDLTRNIDELPNRVDMFNLHLAPHEFNWKLSRRTVDIDLTPYVAEVVVRVKNVARAETLVSTDPEIMSGDPVFAGTRVPIDTVLASVDAGVDATRLRASYPFLTDAHVEAARIYAEVHPRRGRPRRLADANPAWTDARRRVVRPARG